MNLESVTGPSFGVTPPAGHVASDGSNRIRPGGREREERDAGAAPREIAEDLKGPVAGAELQRLIDDLNPTLQRLNEKLGFQVHEGTGQIMVQVVNRESGEVVREAPPHEFLDLAVRMKEMVGLFLDERG